MRIRNIILAIYDQLMRPGAMRNIFITRNAFGIFSINSHVSSNGRKTKVYYPTKVVAQKAAEAMSIKHSVHFSAYKCVWCDGWHIGKNAQNKIKPYVIDEMKRMQPIILANSFYDRLKHLPIADLAPVFGNGVRGRTLSGHRNRWMVEKMRDAGIETIIDLRTADCAKKYDDKVTTAGIEYIHIAIDKGQIDVRKIIDTLPVLFKCMDKGGFYIACAMGLHRTDIAISIYYVFHPSVPIEHVPELIGHRKDGKLRSDDIAQRLNNIMCNLTYEDKAALGLADDYEGEFNRRKRMLFAVNSNFE